MLRCPLCANKATNSFCPDDSYGASADITRCTFCDTFAAVYGDVGDTSIKGTSIPRWNTIVEKAEKVKERMAALESQAAQLREEIEGMFD